MRVRFPNPFFAGAGREDYELDNAPASSSGDWSEGFAAGVVATLAAGLWLWIAIAWLNHEEPAWMPGDCNPAAAFCGEIDARTFELEH